MSMILCRFILLPLVVLCIATNGRGQKAKIQLNIKKLQSAQHTEKEAIDRKDTLWLAEAYYMYGKTYMTAGDYLTSHQYFMKARKILEKRGDSFELVRVYVRISDIEDIQGHLTESLRYGRLALEASQRMKSDKGLLLAYGAIKRVYGKLWVNNYIKTPNHPLYDSILYYNQAAESVAYKLRDTLAMAEISSSIGSLYSFQKNPESFTFLERALKYYQYLNEEHAQVVVMQELATAFLRMSESQKAYVMLTKAEKLYKKTKLKVQYTDVNFAEGYLLYYQSTGNWQQAFVYSEKLRELDKISFAADRTGAISRLNIEYETQKKEAQLKSQQQEIILRTENERNQKIFLLITLALLLVAAGASVAFYRLYRKNQRISRQNEELVKEQNHRVKNNLQVVSSLLNLQARQLPDAAAKRAVTDSQLRIQSMAILHRRLYDGEELAKVNLPEFIQELVHGVLKTFGYQSVVPTFYIATIHLHADKAVPLGLIINELATNACKYAFPYTDAPTLEISCQQKGNKLQLTVADNGPGCNDSLDEEGGVVTSKKSFGMKLIKSQAEQLNAVYDFEQDRGTVFRMMFRI